jgi:hypothetical protein
LPISDLIAIISIFVAYETLYGVYKVMMWVIRRIPTQS